MRLLENNIMNKQELIDFENEIAEIYKEGKIRGPIHLRDGNEDYLIQYFDKYVKPADYKFATWANHLEALLSGVPQHFVKARILDGESMAMNFPDYNFYTSAIVGGICPIAVGMAHALKAKNSNARVHAFIGDMTFMTGIAHESMKYSLAHNLPISWIIADNNKSVCTDTTKTWGISSYEILRQQWVNFAEHYPAPNWQVYYYQYDSKWPHSGVGEFVSF